MNLKKIVAVLMTTLVMLTAVPVSAAELIIGLYHYDYDHGNGLNGVILTHCSQSASGAITIPSIANNNDVVAIKNGAFYGCTQLTKITIPNTVRIIDNYAFNKCSSLKRVEIPYTVTSIGINPFSGCTSLTDIALLGGNAVYHVKDSCLIKTATNELIAGNVSGVIPDYVTTIGPSAFKDYTLMARVTIPSSVTSIEYGAFYGCSSLTSVTVPNNVTSLNISVFERCTSLTNVTLPSHITTIDERTFLNCTSLESIVIPDGVTSIKDFAFSDCKSLKSIVIPDSVTSIGRYAFYGCKSLETVYYEGTTSERNGIKISDVDNTYLTEATWRYDTGIYGDFRYATKADGTVGIVDYLATTAETVIPSEINGRTVSTIEEGALDGAIVIHAYYTGTKKQWAAVTVESGNTSLGAALIHYGTDGTDHWTLQEIAKPSTCLTSGSGTYTCACGYSDSRPIPATGHTYTAAETVAPTCTKDGYTVYRCEDCDYGYKADFTAATGHTHIKAETVAPTCTEDGYTIYRCEDCDNSYQTDFTAATGHTHIAAETVAPTCTEDGYTVYRCENCGDVYHDDAVPAKHTYVVAGVTEPTCTKDGYKTLCCEDCGDEIRQPLAAAHCFKQNVCVYCQKGVSQCLASKHPYANNTDVSWTVRQPDAEKIVLTFAAECALDDGFDFVYIYDENGELIATYTGTELAGASVDVPGEGATIRLVSDESMVYYGYAVTDIKAEFKETDIPKGDVNGDGKLTTADARMIILYTINNSFLDDDMSAYADYNSDGKVNTIDARMLMYDLLIN